MNTNYDKFCKIQTYNYQGEELRFNIFNALIL